MRITLVLFALTAAAQHHPLDGLTTSEYWSVYDALKESDNLTDETLFASVLLRPPDKQFVLTWQPGQAMPRAADVVLLRQGKSFAGVVDIAGKKVVRWEELKDAQAPFLLSEVRATGDVIKKDPRVIEALKKRGITDLRTVQCGASPVAYRAIPEQATQRIGFGGCTQTRGVYHGWGRSIEGLTFQFDMTAKKVLKVIDTDLSPVPSGDTNYEEIPETPRPQTTPIATSQPMGPGYKIEKGEVEWQNWRFRFRIDPRVGLVLNLVRYVDQGKPRSILYEGSVSELFVPYMDTANGWNNRTFFDAGQFYSQNGGMLKPVLSGLDCPAHATFFDGIVPNESGAPNLKSNMACLFERHPESPAWRHGQGSEVYGRPNRQLVLRSAAVIGNYDYILDWRFDPDGTIEVAVGATGAIETRSTVQKLASEHGHDEYGQLVAEHTLGVHHDHFFSYRLDLDVDGAANSFVKHSMVPKRLENDPMRKSIWVAQHSVAKKEKDAILDIKLDQPSMWMFVNPAVKGPLGYPVGYEVMPGATAKSLMTPDDPTQKLGAFSAHQFWVTPHNPDERYASGTYPTSSAASEGLAMWTQANRPIANTDIVGWYTLGFHHIPRSEDWPVMPTMWHHFHIRPFHFFQSNPVLDLPKNLSRP
jgi:primary-amine oxidase